MRCFNYSLTHISVKMTVTHISEEVDDKLKRHTNNSCSLKNFQILVRVLYWNKH